MNKQSNFSWLAMTLPSPVVVLSGPIQVSLVLQALLFSSFEPTTPSLSSLQQLTGSKDPLRRIVITIKTRQAIQSRKQTSSCCFISAETLLFDMFFFFLYTFPVLPVQYRCLNQILQSCSCRYFILCWGMTIKHKRHWKYCRNTKPKKEKKNPITK